MNAARKHAIRGKTYGEAPAEYVHFGAFCSTSRSAVFAGNRTNGYQETFATVVRRTAERDRARGPAFKRLFQMVKHHRQETRPTIFPGSEPRG